MYSLNFSSGLSNFFPCQFSTKAGVLTPKPKTDLLLDNISNVDIPIATVAGVLECILIIAVPSLTLFVTCETAPKDTKASLPQDSGTHKESVFSFSSIFFANLKILSIDKSVPILYPILEISFILNLMIEVPLLLHLYLYAKLFISKSYFSF